MKRVYFPGLNAIRFYAALSVVIVHLGEAASIRGLSSFTNLFQPLEYLFLPGNHAVTLFFVLSGFLITYLLLAEADQTDTINVGKFYLRRILRIWPLYYLVVFLGFVAIPLAFNGFTLHITGYPFTFQDPNYGLKLFLFLVLLPNIAYAIFPGRAPNDHLWSIGVEEQFYLMWPLLVRLFRKHLFWLLYTIILIKIIALVIVGHLFQQTGWNIQSPWLHLYRFLANFRLEAMAIGGLGALVVFRNTQPILRILYSWPVKLVTVAFLIANIAGWHYDFSSREFTLFEMVSAVFYCLFILNIAANPKPLYRLEHPVFTWLGNISYGLYMLHPLVLAVTLHVFRQIGVDDGSNPLFYNLVLYGLVVLGSIALSTFSYFTFERFFLQLKDRFAVVKSGNTAPVEIDTLSQLDVTPTPEPSLNPISINIEP